MKPLSERIAEMYPGDNEEGPWLPPTMTAEVAALESRIEALEKRLAKLQPPSTLDRMIDEGYIDDSPSDY